MTIMSPDARATIPLRSVRMVSLLHLAEKEAAILALGVLLGVALGDLPNMELVFFVLNLGPAWKRNKIKHPIIDSS